MAQVQFGRRMRILVAGVMILLGFCSILGTEEAYGQDLGAPDSLYFGEPMYQPDGCLGSVILTLPVYIWSDRYADYLWFDFRWRGNSDCDTANYFMTGDCDSIAYPSWYVNHEIGLASGGYISRSGGICPTYGAEKLMELVFQVQLDDTLHIWFPPPPSGSAVTVGAYFTDWIPSISLLDTQIFVPDTILVIPGDVDVSGFVSISDAVYLIQYIFSGGCAPWSLSAADPNGDCSNTISDVVYLINYIFAGGPSPQSGCVGQR